MPQCSRPTSYFLTLHPIPSVPHQPLTSDDHIIVDLCQVKQGLDVLLELRDPLPWSPNRVDEHQEVAWKYHILLSTHWKRGGGREGGGRERGREGGGEGREKGEGGEGEEGREGGEGEGKNGVR